MSVARITEITSESTTGFEDAIQQGVARATKTLKNVRSVWVKDQSMEVKDEKIALYRVALKVTFVLDA